MRLIDADELKKTISKYEFDAPSERYKNGGQCVLEFFMPKIIDDEPTVEAEPVKHGKWIDKDMTVECSNCGEEYSDELFLMGGDINRCPNCGAKMEEDNGD